MIFKISFLTLALALSSLDAVIAVLVPKNSDVSGKLNARDSAPADLGGVRIGPFTAHVFEPTGDVQYVCRFVEI